MFLLRYTYTIALSLLLAEAGMAQQPAKRDSIRILDTVTVVSRKPMIVRKADRYIVNIENSNLANGFSGLEVLQRSPGIWVKPDGSIQIMGNQPVTVMINDIIQRMSSMELAEYLKSLRSEDISKIEVIANPPAEYEASAAGGIVHIVLKKARTQGVSGSLSSQYRQQGKRPLIGGGAGLDYKAGRWYVFGAYNFTKDQSHYSGSNVASYPDNSYINSTSTRDNDNTRHQYRTGIVYDISPAQSVNFQHTGTYNNLAQHFYSGISYGLPSGKGLGDANTDWIRRPWFSSTSASYNLDLDTLGSFLKLIGDYAHASKQEANTLISVYDDPSMTNSLRTHTPGITDLYSAQSDLNLVLPARAAIKTGLKYVQTNRENTIVAESSDSGAWVKNPAASDDFRYNEKLLMAYAAAEKKWHRTSLKIGLRAEQTWSRGISLTSGETIRRNYMGWFPSLFADHILNELKGNSIRFNYSRRLKRPAFNDLNPYRLQTSDYNVLTGNPNLQPQFAHNFQAGFVWHREWSAEVYYRITSNFIAQTARTVDDRVIEHMSKNFPRNVEFGLSLSLPVNIADGWRAENNAILYHDYSDLNEQKIRRTSFSLRTSQTFQWKGVIDIDLWAEYTSPYTTANSRMAEIFYSEFGFARSILKKKARIRLYFADPFNVVREKELTEYDNTRIDFYQKRPTRTISLSFSWRFNAGRVFTKKKIDANNTDEKSRMN